MPRRADERGFLGRDHRAREPFVGPDRRSRTLAGMVAHAVVWGTLAERVARARRRRGVPVTPGVREVGEFRRRFLRDRLLAGDEIAPWVEEQLGREGPPASAYLRVPIFDDDIATRPLAGFAKTYADFLCQAAKRLREGGDAELPAAVVSEPLSLSYGPPGGSIGSARIRGDGVLAELKAVATILCDRLGGWREDEAVGFVLAAVAPPLDKLRATSRDGLYQAASRITLDCDPRLTRHEVADLYEDLRRRWLKGGDLLMTERGLALAAFTDRHWGSGVRWADLLALWNLAHPAGDELHYGRPLNQFATECRVFWERVTGEPWPGGTRTRAKS